MEQRHQTGVWARRVILFVSSLPTLTALTLLRVPSFNILDYHACLAISPVMGVTAAVLASQSKRSSPARWLWVTLTPAVVLSLNGLIEPWCAPTTGALFYLLGPLCSALVGVCMGTIARVSGARWTAAKLVGLIALSVTSALWHVYREPQVFVYQGLFGWVAGALYEDNLDVHGRYITFRLINSALWLSLGATALRWRALREATAAPRRPLADPTLQVALAVTLTAVATWTILRPVMQWRLNHHEIVEQLNGEVTLSLAGDAKVVIHLKAKVGWQRKGAVVADEVRHCWRELSDFFGRAPARPVEVFVYPDTARKRSLMGAQNVEMAKPWLRQVHMVRPRWGGSLTRHELAHVFAGEVADNWLGLPMRGGWFPDAALIEGAAVAAEWPLRSRLTPHQWSAAMRKLGLAPKLQTLFSATGFFQHSSARSYTIAGSFLRWLRATHGADTFSEVLKTGSVQEATGSSLQALADAWGRFVDALPLTDVDMARAKARFERPGLFYRPCTLEIGRCRARARRAWAMGDDARAARIWDELYNALGETANGRPIGLDVRRALAFALGQAGRPAQGLAAIAKEDGLTSLQRAGLNALRGDLSAVSGDLEEARQRWRRALLPTSSAGWRRLQLAKVHLSRTPSGVDVLLHSWLRHRALPNHGARMRRLRQAAPKDPLTRYLWSLWRRGRGSNVNLCALVAPLEAADLQIFARSAVRRCAQDQARRGACSALEGSLRRLQDDEDWPKEASQRLRQRCSHKAELSVTFRVK